MALRLKKRVRRAVIFWLARRLPHCRQMAPVFSESLDRRPSLRTRVVIRLHLFTCTRCVRYLKQLRFMRELFEAGERLCADDSAAAPALDRETRERLKGALRPRAAVAPPGLDERLLTAARILEVKSGGNKPGPAGNFRRQR